MAVPIKYTYRNFNVWDCFTIARNDKQRKRVIARGFPKQSILTGLKNLKWLITGSISLMLLLNAVLIGWAEEFEVTPSEDDQSTKEKITDDDLDQLDRELKPDPVEEEDINVMEVLEGIKEKMIDAQDSLSKASTWKAVKEQEMVEKQMEKIIKQQQEALKLLNNLFKKSGDNQQSAVSEMEKLIKMAREIEVQSQSQSQQQSKQQKKEPKQQNMQPQQVQQKPNANQPATKAYEATGSLPPHLQRSSDPTAKWGDLPPKLRDEIVISEDDDVMLEYQERLQRYFKILAEEE